MMFKPIANSIFSKLTQIAIKNHNKLVEIVFPNRCAICSSFIGSEGLFCAQHFRQLRFISDPKCRICSHPYEVSYDTAELACANCLAKKPKYDQAIVSFGYSGPIKKIINQFKYGDSGFLAKPLARFLYQSAAKNVAQADFIIPVPLHIKSLQKRKYNQALMLASALAKLAGNKKVIPDFLTKPSPTDPQASLNRKEREKNLRRAFIINSKYDAKRFSGSRVILVDDVITTGATINACARALKAGGVGEVIVVALAKTVGGKKDL